MTTEITELWYDRLIEDCRDIAVETEFNATWSLLEGRHMLGKRILSENDNFERAQIYGQGICNAVAQSIKRSPRTIYYSIKFAQMFPDLAMLKEGKNISWHHVINKYLTDGKEKPVKVSPTEMIKQIKEMLQTEWMKVNQIVINKEAKDDKQLFGYECEMALLRYLQDQVDKITGGV